MEKTAFFNSLYTGAAQTPATVTVTGAGGLSLTPTASYSNNVNAGTATARYSYAGDANHLPSSASKTFTILGGVSLNGGVLALIGTNGRDVFHVGQHGSTIRV